MISIAYDNSVLSQALAEIWEHIITTTQETPNAFSHIIQTILFAGQTLGPHSVFNVVRKSQQLTCKTGEKQV